MGQNVRYIAARSLVSGHTLGAAYYLELKLTKKDRVRRVSRERQEMLDGGVATTYLNGREVWNCQTPPLALDDALAMREFLDSVEDGQQFTFDPSFGVGASPSDYRAVVMDSSGYTEGRVERGTSQSDHRFRFTFSIRAVP